MVVNPMAIEAAARLEERLAATLRRLRASRSGLHAVPPGKVAVRAHAAATATIVSRRFVICILDPATGVTLPHP